LALTFETTGLGSTLSVEGWVAEDPEALGLSETRVLVDTFPAGHLPLLMKYDDDN
jgi:hypothetical protein